MANDQLRAKVAELERLNAALLDREERMIELRPSSSGSNAELMERLRVISRVDRCHELAELGARVRRSAEDRTADPFDEIARSSSSLDTLRDATAFRAALAARVLARESRGSRCARVRTDGDRRRPRCLVLCATRGIEPAWNSSETSAAHREHAAVGPRGARSRSDGRKLITDFGSPWTEWLAELDAAHRHTGCSSSPDAPGSPAIPAQRDFVLRYGVRVRRSASAARLPGDRASSSSCSRAWQIAPGHRAGVQARSRLHASIALTQASDQRGDAATVRRACARTAYDRLLQLQEYQYLKHASTLAQRAATRRAAQRGARSASPPRELDRTACTASSGHSARC